MRTDGDITIYQHIECIERPAWGEDVIKEHPEWKDETFKDYEIEDEVPEGHKVPTLFSTHVELGCDYRYMAIITVKHQPWIGYYDREKEIIFISPEYTDKAPHYDGIDTQTLIKLTRFLRWDNYRILDYGYDYESSILAIKNAKSNIRPDNLTNGELSLLADRLAEWCTQNNTDYTKKDCEVDNPSDDNESMSKPYVMKSHETNYFSY